MWIAPERSEVVRARTQSRARLLRRENHQLVRSLPPRSSVLRSSPQAETARSQGQGLCAARKPAVQERSASAGRADGAGSSTASCCGATRRARTLASLAQDGRRASRIGAAMPEGRERAQARKNEPSANQRACRHAHALGGLALSARRDAVVARRRRCEWPNCEQKRKGVRHRHYRRYLPKEYTLRP